MESQGFLKIPNDIRFAKGLSTNERWLLSLLHSYQKQSGWCVISNETLADEIGISKRCVIYMIQRLESLNLVEISHKGKERYMKANLEEVRKLGAKSSPKESKNCTSKGAKSAPTGCKICTPKVQNIHPINNINKSIIKKDNIADAILEEETASTSKPSNVDKVKKDSAKTAAPNLFGITMNDAVANDAKEIRAIMDYWNAAMQGKDIPQVRSIKGERRARLKARLTECKGNVKEIYEAIDNAAKSDYLCSSRAPWFTFDWFVCPNNFPKVLEGNYNNRTLNKQENEQGHEYSVKGSVDAAAKAQGRFQDVCDLLRELDPTEKG